MQGRVRVSVALPDRVELRLRRRAADERLSMSEVAAGLIEAGLEGGEPDGVANLPRRTGNERTPAGASPPSSPDEKKGTVSKLMEGRA